MLLELLPRQDDMKELMLIKTSFLSLPCELALNLKFVLFVNSNALRRKNKRSLAGQQKCGGNIIRGKTGIFVIMPLSMN